MPRPEPLGSGFPQPDFSAASSSTPRRRAGSGSSSKRAFQLAGLTSRLRQNSNGSFPAAAASSSMKLSTANPLKECSTDRHHARGTALSAGLYSMRTLGIAYAICSAPPDSSLACDSFGFHKPPIDVEASVLKQATGFPDASTAPRK